MSKRMYADFPDEAYEALMTGEAVDNNGFRAKKGSFYPVQPTYSPMNERQEQLKDAGIGILISAAGYLTFQVILPGVKRFAHEQVYPYVEYKWNKWIENREAKNAAKQMQALPQNQPAPQLDTSEQNAAAESDAAEVVNLDDYRKMA